MGLDYDLDFKMVHSLKLVIERHGYEILFKPEILIAWMMDYNPQDESVFCEYKDAIMLGVSGAFANSCFGGKNLDEKDSFDAQSFFNTYVNENENSIDKKKLADYINILCDVFEIQKFEYVVTDNEAESDNTFKAINLEKNVQIPAEDFQFSGESSEKNVPISEDLTGEEYYRRAESFKKNAVVEDVENYIDNLKKSSDKNFNRASHVLGHLYLKGKYVERNFEKGIEYLDRCVKNGDINSAFEIYNYLRPVDLDRSVDYLKKAAEAGLVQAEYEYALMLYEMGGSDNKAFDYFNRAAEKNHGYSLYYIAVCYQMGKGVGKDVNKAKEYLQKAASMGVSRAKEILEGL